MSITWTPVQRKVSELKELSGNPRKISAQAFELLKKRISERGFHDVLKLDTEDFILSGNQRKQALLDLGIEEVTALVPSRELTKEERQKVILESNRSDGEWDLQLLAQDFEMDTLLDTGFTHIELGIPTSGFNPNFSPDMVASTVDAAEVEKKARELADKFIAESKLLEVVCPKCGNEYKVNA
jgi:hypothetical protein